MKKSFIPAVVIMLSTIGFNIILSNSAQSEQLVGMPNPWVECNEDFQCGAKTAGFDFPLSLSNYSIRAMDGVFEITYPLDENRQVTVRKSYDESNNCDNSGDYTKYPKNSFVKSKTGVKLNTRGSRRKINVMYFAAESGVYSARCPQGMSKKEAVGVFDVIREAEEPKDIP